MKTEFNSDLTIQQQAFVAEYITHFDGTRAAIKAGYSEKTANSQASQLLSNPKVQNKIAAELDEYGAKHDILKKRVINQLTNLAFADIRDYLTFGPEGIVLKQSSTLSRAQASAIVEVKERNTNLGRTVTFKLAQKEKSLELIGRHLAMFRDSDLPSYQATDAANKKIMTFDEFCVNAGYPKPFPKQIEMADFAFSMGVGQLLGARNYGKTDYVTILRSAYEIYLDPSYTLLIGTKVATRGQSIVSEICRACELAGITFEVKNSKVLRIAGMQGKDHSVEALSIGSSLRGRHPKRAILDDIVTPEDTSPAVREKAKKFYSEVCKLTPNVTLIGQPVHKYDLYEELRPILQNKMEVPHGTIPELDADLEAQRLAGVDEASIQASYFLKIMAEGATPFDHIKYIDKFPTGEAAVAFIDPACEGKDYTALTILKSYMEGVAIVGFVWRKAWNHCLEDIDKHLKRFNVKRLCFETNALGDQPLDILRQAFNVGVVGRKSNTNKHSRIMAAGAFAHLLHLSKESDPKYKDHVVKYEYGAEFDDAPDSLASCLQWIGLIRGKN